MGKIFLRALGAAALAALTACSTAYTDPTQLVRSGITSQLLANASTVSLTASSGQTFTFSGINGEAPYWYGITSGPGTIDSTTGVFTAGTTTADATVEIRDMAGQVVEATVKHHRVPVNGNVLTYLGDSQDNRYLGGEFTAVHPHIAVGAITLNTLSGQPDLSFDWQDGLNGAVRAIVYDATHDVTYVGGTFTQYRGVSVGGLLKLDTYGNLDTDFHTYIHNFYDSVSGTPNVNALALDPTGTYLYVGGGFNSYHGVTNSAFRIAKVATSDGSVDTTFHPVSASGGFNGDVYTLAIDATGTSLYAGGAFTTYRGVANSAYRIAKLATADGTLDTTFHPAVATGGFNAAVRTLALSVSGATLYVGGEFTTYRNTADSAYYIAKLATSNGAIDTTFHSAAATSGFNGNVYSLALNAAGSTLFVGGAFSTYRNVANSANKIAKLSASSGNIDTSFYPVSATGGFNGDVLSLALDSAETSLFVAGKFSTYQSVTNSADYIAKLSVSDGTRDTTFFATNSVGANAETAVLCLAGTRLHLAGSRLGTFGGTRTYGFVKFKDDWTLDTDFMGSTPPLSAGQSVRTLALDSTEDYLYVGGSFNTYRGVANSAFNIAKVSTVDGNVDATFHPVSASGGFNGVVNSIDLDSIDSNLFVGGAFTTYRGVADSAYRIAKLSVSSGALNTTFHPNSATGGFDAAVNTLVLDSTDTNMYVGGSFTTYRGLANSAYRIAKLDASSGAPNTTFHTVNANSGFNNGAVTDLVLDATDANLYVAGSFTTYRNVANSAYRIAKLASNGSLNTSFHSASASSGFNNTTEVLALDSTGNYLYVGGQFTTYRTVSNSAYKIAKLGVSTGTIDTTFHPASATSGFSDTVYALFLNSLRTELFVGGSFFTYEGYGHPFFSHLLTADGGIVP